MTISRSLVPPQFGIPPTEYSQHYFADITRAFSVFVVQLQQPGEGRATTMTFTDLPTSDTGLEEGALFMVDGFVKITRLAYPNPAGTSSTGAVGTVTVVIT